MHPRWLAGFQPSTVFFWSEQILLESFSRSLFWKWFISTALSFSSSQISAGVWRHGPAYKGSSEKCSCCTCGSSWKKGCSFVANLLQLLRGKIGKKLPHFLFSEWLKISIVFLCAAQWHKLLRVFAYPASFEMLSGMLLCKGLPTQWLLAFLLMKIHI